MKFLTLIPILFLLGACGPGAPKTTIIGKINNDRILDMEKVAEMSPQDFVKEYGGKEITVTEFWTGSDHIGQNGGINNEQCTLNGVKNLYQPEKEVNYNTILSIKAQINGWPHRDFINSYTAWRKFNNDDEKAYISQDVEYPEEIKIPNKLGFCNPSGKCKFDAETGFCAFRSPNFKMTGKVFGIKPNSGDGENKYIEIVIKLKGIEY